MKVAVVGATGVVGTVMLELLDKRKFPVTEIIPVASERSVGNKIKFHGKDYSIVSLTDAVEMKPDIALFSAGGSTSLEWAPKFGAKKISLEMGGDECSHYARIIFFQKRNGFEVKFSPTFCHLQQKSSFNMEILILAAFSQAILNGK